MRHIGSKIVSSIQRDRRTEFGKLADYSIPSSSRTSHNAAARIMSDGVQASMAPNAIACKVVMDRSPNPFKQRTTQRFNFDQRMPTSGLLCDVNSL
jgi:hypothetical protein